MKIQLTDKEIEILRNAVPVLHKIRKHFSSSYRLFYAMEDLFAIIDQFLLKEKKDV
jgi:hypothetical protein